MRVWWSVCLIYLWHITKTWELCQPRVNVSSQLNATSHPVAGRQGGESCDAGYAGWGQLCHLTRWQVDSLGGGVWFVTLEHHQYHSPTQSTLCKNIHYLNVVTEIAGKVWDTLQLLKNTWNHKQKNERPYFERMKANRETGRNEVSISLSKMMKKKSCCKNRTIKCIGP